MWARERRCLLREQRKSAFMRRASKRIRLAHMDQIRKVLLPYMVDPNTKSASEDVRGRATLLLFVDDNSCFPLTHTSSSMMDEIWNLSRNKLNRLRKSKLQEFCNKNDIYPVALSSNKRRLGFAKKDLIEAILAKESCLLILYFVLISSSAA